MWRVAELGVTFYRGPSLLTGEPIVGVLTGLEGGSLNPKTGGMAQAWIIRPDLAPQEAKRRDRDDAICGDCRHRGHGGEGSTCYVPAWLGPTNVWKMFTRGGYPEATWPDLQAVVEGRHVRLGAYGDPAALPFEVWRTLLVTVAGWVGYTHVWKICDARFKTILMASVDTEAEFIQAGLRGWRTFRVRGQSDPLMTVGNIGRPNLPASTALEFACPASDEMNHRTTCQRCQLCRGTSSPARSVAIVAHGHDGVMANFYRNRDEAHVA
jgi:hypothetical protein